MPYSVKTEITLLLNCHLVGGAYAFSVSLSFNTAIDTSPLVFDTVVYNKQETYKYRDLCFLWVTYYWISNKNCAVRIRTRILTTTNDQI